jgi:thiopeptide-type bacteriocin biosynthesis protein
VACALLTGNPARFDEIISVHLPGLLAGLDELAESWWLRRHRDMTRPEADQHLAVCLRLTGPGDFAAAAAALAAFADALTRRGLPGQLTLASYPQHPARYGRGDALTAAERVFAADTTAAVAQITTASTAAVPGQALAAASMAQIAASFAPDPASGLRSLITCLNRGSGPADRALREHACRLGDPSGDFEVVRGLPGGDTIAATWAGRDAALAAYHDALSRQRDPGTVLRTLLHEHHMRALGIDPRIEEQTGRLARAVALRRLALAGKL